MYVIAGRYSLEDWRSLIEITCRDTDSIRVKIDFEDPAVHPASDPDSPMQIAREAADSSEAIFIERGNTFVDFIAPIKSPLGVRITSLLSGDVPRWSRFRDYDFLHDYETLLQVRDGTDVFVNTKIELPNAMRQNNIVDTVDRQP